jgi:hypothetical protein
MKGFKEFRRKFPDSDPITVHTIVDGITIASTLIDTGSLTYGIVSSKFVEQHHLKRTKIPPRPILGVGRRSAWMRHVVPLAIDINSHEERIWAYEVDGEEGYDLILGRPWMDKNNVTIALAKRSLFIHSSQTRVRSHKGKRPTPALRQVNASAYTCWMQRSRKDEAVQCFSASMADVQKALRSKKRIDPRSVLPDYLQSEFRTFLREEADKLAPLRGPSVDHAIELIETEGKQPEIPWGPLYSMSKEELLVLRLELTSYLEKGFIRVSRSSAAAPVLFAKKPGGGLRFCGLPGPQRYHEEGPIPLTPHQRNPPADLQGLMVHESRRCASLPQDMNS